MRRLATPFVLATPLTVSLVLVAELRIPSPNEPIAARWARTAAAHPIRSWLALSLLAAAFLGPKGGRWSLVLPNSPPVPRERGSFELG